MDCGVIPLSISYNKSLVILWRMAIYNFNVLNVLYVYMCIDETIIKNKILKKTVYFHTIFTCTKILADHLNACGFVHVYCTVGMIMLFFFLFIYAGFSRAIKFYQVI
jgi:hypothetical protein